MTVDTTAYNFLPPLSSFSKVLIRILASTFYQQILHRVLSALSSIICLSGTHGINIGQLTEVAGRNNIEQLTGRIKI